MGKKSRRKKSSAEFKWTEGDPSCPAGWKIRVVNCADGHSVTFFLTPEGTTIKGREQQYCFILFLNKILIRSEGSTAAHAEDRTLQSRRC